MILASHQPDFFPWMGYFYKIFLSDIFVFSDNVQYSKSARHNYNQINTHNGPLRITLPIHYHAVNINELEIVHDHKAIEKIKKTLVQEYKKSSYFQEVCPVIEDLLDQAEQFDILSEYNLHCIRDLVKRFGLDKDRRFFISSQLDLHEKRDKRIIEMCKLLGADVYVSGSGAKDYHIEEDYRNNGIELVYSDYTPIQYEQVGMKPAENMCVIDYAMNCGFNLPSQWVRRSE